MLWCPLHVCSTQCHPFDSALPSEEAEEEAVGSVRPHPLFVDPFMSSLRSLCVTVLTFTLKLFSFSFLPRFSPWRSGLAWSPCCLLRLHVKPIVCSVWLERR